MVSENKVLEDLEEAQVRRWVTHISMSTATVINGGTVPMCLTDGQQETFDCPHSGSTGCLNSSKGTLVPVCDRPCLAKDVPRTSGDS